MALLSGNFATILFSAFALHLCFLSTKAQAIQPYSSPAWNASNSSIQDYISSNYRQYEAQIAEYESRIAAFRISYEKQLKPLESQRNLVEQKVSELENRLNPLELLSDLSKYCVHKYRYNLTTVSAVRAPITSCLFTANNYVNSLISSPNTLTNTFRNYINNNVRSTLNNCQRNHNASLTNYTICVTDVIAVANTYASSNRNTFNTVMHNAECSADQSVQRAVECSFTTVYDAISNIGQVKRLIDDCLNEADHCPECEESCRYSIDVHYNKDYYYNETITNPFFNRTSHVDCMSFRLLDVQ